MACTGDTLYVVQTSSVAVAVALVFRSSQPQLLVFLLPLPGLLLLLLLPLLLLLLLLLVGFFRAHIPLCLVLFRSRRCAAAAAAAGKAHRYWCCQQCCAGSGRAKVSQRERKREPESKSRAEWERKGIKRCFFRLSDVDCAATALPSCSKIDDVARSLCVCVWCVGVFSDYVSPWTFGLSF